MRDCKLCQTRFKSAMVLAWGEKGIYASSSPAIIETNSPLVVSLVKLINAFVVFCSDGSQPQRQSLLTSELAEEPCNTC